MISEAIKIFSEPCDENLINREIEAIYKNSGFDKPTILILDSIAACRAAYSTILTFLYNNDKNLMDEHQSNIYRSVVQKRRFGVDKTTIKINNINTIIEEHYKDAKDYSSLLIIKKQLLQNIRPKSVEKSLWDITPEQTKEVHRDRIWNDILNSKANLFEYIFDSNVVQIHSMGITSGVFLKNYCILCKNPKQILENKSGELHSTEGYAIEFNDKSGIYFVKGIQFDKELYTKIFIDKNINGKDLLQIKDEYQFYIALEYIDRNKLINEITGKDIVRIKNRGVMEKITNIYGYDRLIKDLSGKDILKIKFIEVLRKVVEVYDREKFAKEVTGKDIMKIKNVETKAILIQFFGYNNLLKELNAKLIDAKDEFSNLDNTPISYELYEFEMNVRERSERMEKFRFVMVEDYSTHKKVTLGVPITKETKTCMGAIAWTFGMTEEEYNPQVQT